MTDANGRPDGRRDRYADAIRSAGDTAYGREPFYGRITTAAMAVADVEQADHPLTDGPLRVKGRCPACGHDGLLLGEGGYATCSRISCPEPDAASTASRVRHVLETESVEGRTALEYRGLLIAALMAGEEQQ